MFSVFRVWGNCSSKTLGQVSFFGSVDNDRNYYVNLSPLSDCMEPVAATVPRSAVRQKEAAAKETVGNTAENLKQEAIILCEVVEDFYSQHPERLTLKVCHL